MDVQGDRSGVDTSGPYNPEIFASQISRSAARFLDPDAQVKPDLIRKPDPITLYFGYWGKDSWRRTYGSFLMNRLRDGSLQVDRRLTQSEVDAYVETNNRLAANYRRGMPLGFAFGVSKWFVYEGKYKHPLLFASAELPYFRRFVEGTKMLFRMDPALGKQLLVSLGWRTFVYTVVGGFGMEIAAVIIMGTQILRDPRMQQFHADLKTHSPEEIKARREQAHRERMAQQTRIFRERTAEQRNQAGQSQSSEETSPQNGGYDESAHTIDTSSFDSATASDYTPPPETGTTPATRTSRYGSRAPAEQNKGTGFFDDDDDDDDASPTAPEYRGIVRRENASAGQGSAWERIRNQAQSGIPSDSGSASSSGSAWNQSEASVAASDSQRERERAQAEFNRMLDAERNQRNQ
jgi:hypothetical protein